MSGEIFIETDKVQWFGLPLAEHLYLVFRDINDEEYVLRAGPRSIFWPVGPMVIEANVPMEDSADDRGDDTPEERSSTPLDFPGLTDDQAWAMMVKYARSIEDAQVQNWIAASENPGGRPGRPALFASHAMSLSSQISSDPRRLSASL